jgi:hypothetical protein
VRKLARKPAFIEALYAKVEIRYAELIPDNERRIAILDQEIKELNQQIGNLMDTLQSSPSAIVRDLVTRELESEPP